MIQHRPLCGKQSQRLFIMLVRLLVILHSKANSPQPVVGVRLPLFIATTLAQLKRIQMVVQGFGIDP